MSDSIRIAELISEEPFGRLFTYMGKKGGASTVTQQLAKMQFHDRDRNNLFKTIFQKFQEWVVD